MRWGLRAQVGKRKGVGSIEKDCGIRAKRGSFFDFVRSRRHVHVCMRDGGVNIEYIDCNRMREDAGLVKYLVEEGGWLNASTFPWARVKLA